MYTARPRRFLCTLERATERLFDLLLSLLQLGEQGFSSGALLEDMLGLHGESRNLSLGHLQNILVRVHDFDKVSHDVALDDLIVHVVDEAFQLALNAT